MNKIKVFAKLIIKEAALHHTITPLQLIRLFRCSQIVPDSNFRAFANLLAMCMHPDHRLEIDAFLHSNSPAIIPIDLCDTQLAIDKARFLYNIIDNYYLLEVQTYAKLSFYPRLIDLFKSQLAETNTPIVATPEPTQIPVVQPFVDMPIIWNKQQNEAFNLIHAWLRTENRKPIFRLFGWAGTGKTLMSKAIADFVMVEAGKNNVPTGNVLFAAYTGKAASVLRTKGCRNADTLHSFLYKPRIDPDTGKCTEFVLNGESPLSTASLLIVDEVSMVNQEMADDILSFNVPILVLGDPEQLPPVKGEGFFIEAEPDYMLTDIERQAAENPIIMLATRARLGKDLKPGKYGDSVIYDIGYHVDPDMYASHDQILCGLNATRKTINNKARRIQGYADKNPIYPVKGEKLICTRNNRTTGIYNGTLWTASQPTIQKVMKPIFKGSALLKQGDVDVLAFKVRSLDELDANGKPYVVETQCSLHHFNDNIKEPAYRDIAGTDNWEFGHAISVHKSQGSQFDSVLLFDESSSFRDNARKHLYTALTRAAERITILL